MTPDADGAVVSSTVTIAEWIPVHAPGSVAPVAHELALLHAKPTWSELVLTVQSALTPAPPTVQKKTSGVFVQSLPVSLLPFAVRV